LTKDPATDLTSQPEKTSIPVRGECGHVFTAPLARMRDGAEFKCPVCGQPDRFDDDAVRRQKEAFAKMRAEGTLDEMAAQISEYLSAGEGEKQD